MNSSCEEIRQRRWTGFGYRIHSGWKTKLANIPEGKTMSDDNNKTLCAHVEEELHVNDPKAYIALISPATHFCGGCGRSAANAENLCKPQKI
jgi:hypothetical protein